MSLDVHLERIVDATPEEAFAAWIDPTARLGWYAPVDGWIVEATSDLRVGGDWCARFGPTADEMYTEAGKYTEIDVTFEAVDGKTRLVVADIGYPNEEQRAAHENGWPSFLDAYERYLARA